MVGISIRLEDQLKERLDEVAAKQNTSISEIIRDALEEKLKIADRKHESTSSLPSRNERLMLSNQYEILSILDPESAASHRKKKKIIQDGYSLNYGWMTNYIEPEVSKKTCVEVLRILDMYSALGDSLYRLDNKDGISEEDVSFSGFDGNNETDLMAYAKFLIFDEGKFSDLLDVSGFALNSHFPIMNSYRKCLDRWASKKEPHRMDVETIRYIIDKPKGY